VTVSLTNASGRYQVFVLTHETFCRARGTCACDLEEGRHARRTARSLTLTTGVTSAELDDAVLSIPEVARAVKRGELTVKRHVPEPPRPTPAAALLAPAKKKRGTS